MWMRDAHFEEAIKRRGATKEGKKRTYCISRHLLLSSLTDFFLARLFDRQCLSTNGGFEIRPALVPKCSGETNC